MKANILPRNNQFCLFVFFFFFFFFVGGVFFFFFFFFFFWGGGYFLPRIDVKMGKNPKFFKNWSSCILIDRRSYVDQRFFKRFDGKINISSKSYLILGYFGPKFIFHSFSNFSDYLTSSGQCNDNHATL